MTQMIQGWKGTPACGSQQQAPLTPGNILETREAAVPLPHRICNFSQQNHGTGMGTPARESEATVLCRFSGQEERCVQQGQ